MSRFSAKADTDMPERSALFFVLKGTSVIAKRAQTKPVLQTQICPSHSCFKPGPYCIRIEEDTSHHYLALTRKREKRESG